MARSFALDKCSYGVADDNGKQYLTFSKALCGRKLWVPLKGYTDLYRKSGRLAKDGTRNLALPNIRVVLQGDHIEVHYGVDVESPKASTGAVVGVDFGYSEVAVDSDGNHHGERFGDLMTEATEQRTAKGRNRGKLYALERKHAANGDHKKARNIRKFNLGRQKLDAQHCARCGHEGHADEVAALNILGRMDDENITRYTPYQRVKSILLERFQGRQESEGPAYKIAKIEPRCPSAPLTPGLETRDEEAKAA